MFEFQPLQFRVCRIQLRSELRLLAIQISYLLLKLFSVCAARRLLLFSDLQLLLCGVQLLLENLCLRLSFRQLSTERSFLGLCLFN